MARIVLISPYLKGGQNAAKLAQRTRYVATRPGVELLVDERSTLPATKKQQEFIARLLKSFPSCWELIEYEEYLDHPTQGSASAFIQQVQEDYMEALEQKENFIDYISHRPGVQKDGEHGLWDAHGKVQNLAQAIREVAEHPGNVWTPVVALRREDAERLGYDSAENWQALVNASICDIAKAYKIRPENLRWYAAFHQKPNQVHIHMIIFSADPKEGYLTKEGIREMKSVFARRIYHADRMHIYQQKDTARQELQVQTRKAMVECIAQLEHGTSDNPRLEQLTGYLAGYSAAWKTLHEAIMKVSLPMLYRPYRVMHYSLNSLMESTYSPRPLLATTASAGFKLIRTGQSRCISPRWEKTH